MKCSAAGGKSEGGNMDLAKVQKLPSSAPFVQKDFLVLSFAFASGITFILTVASFIFVFAKP